MDASILLAQNIVRSHYDDIPVEVPEAIKKDILDTLGVAIAGSSAPGGREIMELILEWGGKEESTVIMLGHRVPSPYAALVNGTMAHALDFDDAHEKYVLHAGVTVIPAAFAVAERVGQVSGKEFITALSLGIDVICRLGAASIRNPSDLGHMYTSLYGVFGATAAAGKILGLDEQEMVNAFGIAYSQASGNFQCIVDGALTKRMQAGFASSSGVTSALLASKGLTGAKNSFEGLKGLFQVYHRGEYDPQPLTFDLGKNLGVTGLSFKPYPCCRNCHPFIDATLALAEEHNINPDNIDEILVRCGEVARILCEPLLQRQQPRVVVDAQFSIPWVVATALVKRKVTLEDFTPEAILNPSIKRITSKITAEVDPQMDSRGTTSAFVQIRMKDSRAVCSRREDLAKGNPEKPMSFDEICDKFRNCTHYGVKTMSVKKASRVINMIRDLEKVNDVSQIIRLLG